MACSIGILNQTVHLVCSRNAWNTGILPKCVLDWITRYDKAKLPNLDLQRLLPVAVYSKRLLVDSKLEEEDGRETESNKKLMEVVCFSLLFNRTSKA